MDSYVYPCFYVFSYSQKWLHYMHSFVNPFPLLMAVLKSLFNSVKNSFRLFLEMCSILLYEVTQFN